jgi:lipopolysaccharide transport system ATP-binding protein
VKVKGRIASLLEVGTGFHPDLTGRENIYLNGAILGMTKPEITRKFDEIVAFAEIEKFIDTPVKRFSSGMYVRLAFAVAAHLESEILLVDEVLAVGDAEFQKKCLGKMGDVASNEGRTVCFVSHNMAAIKYLCERGILLQKGEILSNSRIEDVVNEYLLSITTKDNHQRNSSTLYTNQNPKGDIGIVSVEIEDIDGNPKEQIFTWDDIRLKIKYFSKTLINNGSLVIKISDQFGNPLILLSTQPDSRIPMKINNGIGQGECIITHIPLTGGDYIFGCGIAIPNKEYLFFDENMAILTIRPKDVFGSGLATQNSRALLAIMHEWIIEK